MRLQKRLKRSTKQYIIVAFICLSVLGGAAAATTILLTGQIREEYQALLKDVTIKMESSQRKVFIAAVDILAGEELTADKLEEKTVLSSQPQSMFITRKDIGMLALIDITAGTQIISSMITDNFVASELREAEYDVIHMNLNITNNDSVDVRILYPNGETYVVLSKKLLKGYIPESGLCCFWLNEEELLRMSAAIVDAGLYSGSKLYVTKYIEPNIQTASIVDYVPSLSILSLLESNPNILQKASQDLNRDVRKRLENRLADSMITDVSSINWDVNPNVHAEISSAPTPAPKQSEADENTDDAGPWAPDELGAADPSKNYFYYAEEESAVEGDIEYGE